MSAVGIPKSMAKLAASYGKKLELQEGRKHLRVVLDGVFVCILPKGGNASHRDHNSRAHKNALAHLKRALDGRYIPPDRKDIDNRTARDPRRMAGTSHPR